MDDAELWNLYEMYGVGSGVDKKSFQCRFSYRGQNLVLTQPQIEAIEFYAKNGCDLGPLEKCLDMEDHNTLFFVFSPVLAPLHYCDKIYDFMEKHTEWGKRWNEAFVYDTGEFYYIHYPHLYMEGSTMRKFCAHFAKETPSISEHMYKEIYHYLMIVLKN